jgi:hypothetical protein
MDVHFEGKSSNCAAHEGAMTAGANKKKTKGKHHVER